MNDLFNPSLQCKQFQVGQSGVKHIRHGACEIQHIEFKDGNLYYVIKIIENGMKLKCVGSSLTCEALS